MSDVNGFPEWGAMGHEAPGPPWKGWGLGYIAGRAALLGAREAGAVNATIAAILVEPYQPSGYLPDDLEWLDSRRLKVRLAVTSKISIVYEICPDMPPVAQRVVVFRQLQNLQVVQDPLPDGFLLTDSQEF